MSKIFLTLIYICFSSLVFAAPAPPSAHSLGEFRAIVDALEQSNTLDFSGSIKSIGRKNDGTYVVFYNKDVSACSLKVKIEHTMVGPGDWTDSAVLGSKSCQ